jgi:tetratricopeptide (TPR) repeat protein
VNIERKLKQAVELQQCGRLDEAQGIFEVVLESRPADFVSLYSLGVIAAQSRQPRKALHFIDKAISVNPSYSGRLKDTMKHSRAMTVPWR